MHAVGMGCQSDIGPAVHQNLCGKFSGRLTVAHFYDRQRELEQLARREVFFADLDVIDTKVHLVANGLEQRAKAAERLTVGDVIPLHCSHSFCNGPDRRRPIILENMPSAQQTYRYQVVDVFSQRPLEGNPLAVFMEANALDEGMMQNIARELNLSETVFVLPATRPDCVARLRIFTPRHEVAFAGPSDRWHEFPFSERGHCA